MGIYSDSSGAVGTGRTIPVHINGKLVTHIDVRVGADENGVRFILSSNDTVCAGTRGMVEKKFLYVPEKIIDITVAPPSAPFGPKVKAVPVPVRRDPITAKGMTGTELLVTLWPSFPHFERFAKDPRVSGGIRLNSAMMSNPELDKELEVIRTLGASNPLFFDIKGRQPRIVEVIPNRAYLDLRLNHPISVETPSVVTFKAGLDSAVLDRLEEGGRRLIFQGGPHYKVKAGESLYVRHPSFKIHGDLFTPEEVKKIEKVKKAGFTKYFLSYVEEQRDLDQFHELVGKDAEVWLKIESMPGLDFVANHFKKRDNHILVAARGDLYVEIDKPHHIPQALRLIVEKDPDACVASRILLSVSDGPVPSCADFIELAWLHDIGYRRMMLCDELCLKEDLLATAVNAFDSFRQDYKAPKQGVTAAHAAAIARAVVGEPKKKGIIDSVRSLFGGR